MDGAGVIDEDVESTVMRLNAVEETFGPLGIAERGLKGRSSWADGQRRLVGGATVAMHSDRCAGFGECRGDCRAQATGRSRDQSDFAI